MITTLVDIEDEMEELITALNGYWAEQERITRWRSEWFGRNDQLGSVYIDHDWHKEGDGHPYAFQNEEGDIEFYIFGRQMGWGMSWHSLIEQDKIVDKSTDEILQMCDSLIFVRFDLPEKTVPMPPSQYKVPYKLMKRCNWLGDIIKKIQEIEVADD